MKRLSKKTVRLIGLASIALVLISVFSCKKDKTDSNNPDLNGGQSVQPLIASADINNVTEGEMIDFKCYYQKNYGEVINYGDTSLILRFPSTDKYGEEIDGSDIIIMILSENGFHQGDVFNLAED